MANRQPDRTPLSSFTPEECVKLVHAAIGKEIPIDFQSSMPWVLRRKVAYQYHKGLVVLAGDSAHSFPPTGGLGLNSGIADAHNLAYKVAAAYHGWADLPTVLRAYEAERRPVAVHNSIQSVHNGRTVFRLLKALYSSGPIEEARRRMHATLRDPNKAPFINALIADQAGHFDNVSGECQDATLAMTDVTFQINRHLGYVYEPGWAPGKQRDFAPIYKRGARLAHAWIKAKSNINKLTTVDPVYLDYLDDQDLSPKKKQAWTYSTLDCIPHGEYVFFYSCSSWRKKTPALRELFARCRVPLRLLEVGKDFDFVDKKPGKAWSEGYGINKKNGVLVRPDQHVAVIAHSDVGPELILSGVLTDLGKR